MVGQANALVAAMQAAAMTVERAFDLQVQPFLFRKPKKR